MAQNLSLDEQYCLFIHLKNPILCVLFLEKGLFLEIILLDQRMD